LERVANANLATFPRPRPLPVAPAARSHPMALGKAAGSMHLPMTRKISARACLHRKARASGKALPALPVRACLCMLVSGLGLSDASPAVPRQPASSLVYDPTRSQSPSHAVGGLVSQLLRFTRMLAIPFERNTTGTPSYLAPLGRGAVKRLMPSDGRLSTQLTMRNDAQQHKE